MPTAGSRTRPPTWSPTRSPTTSRARRPSSTGTPPCAFRHHLWSLRPRRRRGDGHRPARHGPGLGRHPRADPAQRRRGRGRRRARSPAGSAPTSSPPVRPPLDDDRRPPTRSSWTIVAARPARRSILMASRRAGRGRHAARRLPRGLRRAARRRRDQPVILHWLGDDVRPGAGRLLGLGRPGRGHRDGRWRSSREHADKVDGIKVSLLDAEREIALRRRAARPGVRLYTGDDFNYPELIAGDDAAHSTRCWASSTRSPPAAAAALAALDAGDLGRFRAILDPTVPLARHIFADADLPLQDRHRVPGLARTGTRTTSRWSAGQRALAASAPHLAELLALADAGRCAARPRPGRGPARVTVAVRLHERLSLNPATVKNWHARRGRAAVRASRHHRHRAVAGRGRGQRSALARPARSSTAGLGRHQPVPGRLLHRRPEPDGAGRQPARPSTRRPTLGTASWSWSSAGCPRARGTSPRARRHVADALGELAPVCRGGTAYGWPSSRCTRCSAPTGRWSPRWARRSTWPQPFDPDVVGVVVDTYHVWWDPRAVRADRPGRAARIAATRCATGSCRCRRTCCSAAGHVGDGRIDFAPITDAVRAAGLRRPRRGGDLQPGGLGHRPGDYCCGDGTPPPHAVRGGLKCAWRSPPSAARAGR